MARTSRSAPSSGKGQPPVRVVVVVEATAAAAGAVAAGVSDFVGPLLTALAARAGPPLELALVAYRGRPPHSPAAVVRSPWTADPARFRAWLDATPFTGGGRDGPCLTDALAAAGRLFRSPSPTGVPPGDCPRHLVLVALSEPHRSLVPWPHPADCVRAPGRAAADEAVLGAAARGVGLTCVLPPGYGGRDALPYGKRLATLFVAAAGEKDAQSAAAKARLRDCAVRGPAGAAGGLALVSPLWPDAKALLSGATAAAAATKRGGGGGGGSISSAAAAAPAASSSSSAVKRPRDADADGGASAPLPRRPLWTGPVAMAPSLAARAGAAAPAGAAAGGAPLFDAALLPSASAPPWPPAVASVPSIVVVRVMDAAAASAAAMAGGRSFAACPRGRLLVRRPGGGVAGGGGASPPTTLGASLLDWLAGGADGARRRVVAVAAAGAHALLVTAGGGGEDVSAGLPVFLLPDEVAARLMGHGE